MTTSKVKTYSFIGQEDVYARFRPNWTEEHARWSLKQAGISPGENGSWSGSAGTAPVVASLGAGTGSDAEVFKRLGCHVILVEPNERFLQIARARLEAIESGTAEYILGSASRSIGMSVDLAVSAQSLHTFGAEYSAQHLDAEQITSNISFEEAVRQAVLSALADRYRNNFSVWYYNPDAREALTHTLHEVLRAKCPKYAMSKTPLVNAERFRPIYFQPWLSLDTIIMSPMFHLPPITLRRDDIKDWLSSYSFRPDQNEIDEVVDTLQNEWFDRYSINEKVLLPYVSTIWQGTLRSEALPMEKVVGSNGSRSPLDSVE